MAGFGVSSDDFFRQNPGANKDKVGLTQGFRNDGSFGTIAGFKQPNMSGAGIRTESGLGIAGNQNKGGNNMAVFVPTKSGLFADGAQPFGGQTGQNRSQLFAQQKGLAAPTRGGNIPGSTF